MAMPTAKINGAKAKTSFVHDGFQRTEKKRAVRKKYVSVAFCPRDEIFTSEEDWSWRIRFLLKFLDRPLKMEID